MWFSLQTSYKAGEYIVRQGAYGDTFFIISQGRVSYQQPSLKICSDPLTITPVIHSPPVNVFFYFTIHAKFDGTIRVNV